jgi:hypothetical protein
MAGQLVSRWAQRHYPDPVTAPTATDPPGCLRQRLGCARPPAHERRRGVGPHTQRRGWGPGPPVDRQEDTDVSGEGRIDDRDGSKATRRAPTPCHARAGAFFVAGDASGVALCCRRDGGTRLYSVRSAPGPELGTVGVRSRRSSSHRRHKNAKEFATWSAEGQALRLVVQPAVQATRREKRMRKPVILVGSNVVTFAGK